MSGYTTYQRWQRIEEQARIAGFRLGKPNHCYNDRNYDVVSLYPADDALPVWSRDAELFVGTFSDVEIFLAGWSRAQQYDHLLRMTDDRRREKFEAAERARQAERRKREEQAELVKVLKATDEDNRKGDKK